MVRQCASDLPLSPRPQEAKEDHSCKGRPKTVSQVWPCVAFLCGNIGASDHLSFFCFLPLFCDTNISKVSSYVGCLGLDSCRPWLQFGSIKKWISCEFHPLTSEVSFDVTSVHPVVVTDMRLIHDIHYMKQKSRRVYLSADGVTFTSTSIPISSSPLSLFIFFFLLLSLL